MQKLFGLLVIVGLIWFGLSVYTGDGRGGIDLGSWLEPIGGDDDTGLSAQRSTQSQSRQNIGRPIRAKGETLPQAMKRKVQGALQKSYDRAEP